VVRRRKYGSWVIELDGDAHANSASTQRINLTLHPTAGGGGSSGASGSTVSAYVSGTEVPDER
jgi:hypothetical protein